MNNICEDCLKQEFSFEIVLNPSQTCKDCQLQSQCDLSQFVCMCDRFMVGPPWKRNTEEYEQQLIDMLNYLKTEIEEGRLKLKSNL